MSILRYLANAEPTKVTSAEAEVLPKFPRVDVGTTATLAFPTPRGSSTTGSADGLTATLMAHFRLPPLFGFIPRWPTASLRVSGTHGTAELNLFPGVWVYHYIAVESSELEGGPLRKRTEKHYGNVGWTTWVSSSCALRSLIWTLCVDTVTNWRHLLTRCAAAHPSIGTTPRTLSATWNG